MLKLMEGFPPGVLAVEAVGKVTHKDYQEVLIPIAERMMASGPVRMLFLAGTEFTGYALEAMWDDSVFGFRHWHDFGDIAVVTDHGWLRAAVTMFRPFFHREVQLFRVTELAKAKAWIMGPEITAI